MGVGQGKLCLILMYTLQLGRFYLDPPSYWCSLFNAPPPLVTTKLVTHPQFFPAHPPPCTLRPVPEIASSEAIIFLEISFLKIVKKFHFLLNISCLIFDSTKTIRLLALNFYETIVDSGFALINYHLIEISSS